MPDVSDERPPARVLLVEDDRGVRESLARALSLEGYEVETTPDGIEAMQVVDKLAPDVIVLDVMMPVMDGLEVARRIRSRGDRTPILMLTARHEVTDRVAGLDAGADDYLVKPFALDELLARLRALLRRTDPVPGEATALELADLRLDPTTRQVFRGDREVLLTKTEFDLLELLMRNAGIVMTREQVYEDIWGYDFESSSNSLDVYIGYLRRKTEEFGEPRLIQTVRGVGYVLRPGSA
jgi:two-component system response regulator MprA